MDMNEFNKPIIDEFRANGGVVKSFGEVPLLILTTTGAKSGESRENPLAYMVDGDRFIVIASYAGNPRNPPWYYNLIANANVTVEMGSERFDALAEVVGEPERSRIYAEVEKQMPIFTEYQSNTDRIIPIITLTRLG